MNDQQPRTTAIEPAYAAAMPAPQGGALPTGLEWQALERMAHMLADSELIPWNLKRKPGDVAVILLAAREYGIPPLMALGKLPVVNGRPAPMGELMVALVLRAGHSIRADFKAPDGSRYKGGPLTPQHYGEAIVRRRDWPAGVEESLTFTLEEAVAANLVDLVGGRPRARDKKDNPTPWELYTPNMARWRAVANVCRLYFPDVLMGLSYLPEELGAIVDADGAPVMGEVVQQQPRQADAAGLEQRTAQEAADRLPDFVGPLDVLDNVLRHAEENGYDGCTVRTPEGPLALSVAIARRRAWLAANTVTPDPDQTPAPGTIDSDGVEEADVVDPEAPQEPASAAQEPQQPTGGTTEQPKPGETPQEAAYDLAREALVTSSRDVLLTLYQGSDDELRTIDVLPVVDDADLATLNAPAGLESLPLGALLMQAGKYVAANGCAIRDPKPEPRTAEQQISDTPDPWADGSGTADAGVDRDA